MTPNFFTGQNTPKLRPLIIIFTIALYLPGCGAIGPQPNLHRNLDTLESRVIALEKQKQKAVSDLRRENRIFKEKVTNDIENIRKSQRFFLTEFERLKSDVELLINDIEKSQNTARLLNVKLNRLIKKLGDISIEVDELKQYFKEEIDAELTPSDEQKQEYRRIYQLFKKKQFKQAEVGFLEFVKKYPSSELADDSMFLLSYVHYLSGDYLKASTRFFEFLSQFPQSNRRDEAKWWLGVSLERSGDINGALDQYKELLQLPKNNPLRVKAEFRIEELTPE